MKAKPFIAGQLVLAIDFDGTITTEPDMGSELVLQPDCKQVLEEFKEDDIRLILWTCRTGSALDEALLFLEKEHMIHLFDTFNDQLPEIVAKYAPDVARKLGADFYIDDKNLGTVINWKSIGENVKNLRYTCAES